MEKHMEELNGALPFNASLSEEERANLRFLKAT